MRRASSASRVPRGLAAGDATLHEREADGLDEGLQGVVLVDAEVLHRRGVQILRCERRGAGLKLQHAEHDAPRGRIGALRPGEREQGADGLGVTGLAGEFPRRRHQHLDVIGDEPRRHGVEPAGSRLHHLRVKRLGRMSRLGSLHGEIVARAEAGVSADEVGQDPRDPGLVVRGGCHLDLKERTPDGAPGRGCVSRETRARPGQEARLPARRTGRSRHGGPANRERLARAGKPRDPLVAGPPNHSPSVTSPETRVVAAASSSAQKGSRGLAARPRPRTRPVLELLAEELEGASPDRASGWKLDRSMLSTSRGSAVQSRSETARKDRRDLGRAVRQVGRARRMDSFAAPTPRASLRTRSRRTLRL